jgi:hypothetical protein
MLASLLKSRCLKVNLKHLAWNASFQKVNKGRVLTLTEWCHCL